MGPGDPVAAYWGIQTLRAVENFPITGQQSQRILSWSGLWPKSSMRPCWPTLT